MTETSVPLNEVADYIQAELCGIYSEAEFKSLRRIILDTYTELDPMDIHLQPDIEIDYDSYVQIKEIVTELKTFKPIQYIQGYAAFYGLYYKVNPNVLIPRPETEELADWVIKANRSKEVSILDIGTGSGCIAVTLADNIPHCEIDAIDISSEAIATAKTNAQMYKRNINFFKYDILQGHNGFNSELFKEKYDIIVSNPPYVKLSEKEKMHPNVLNYEPHIALFVDDEDPLLFYRVISDFARIKLEMGGLLFFEINETHEADVVAMLNDKGFRNVQCRPDINGKPRFARAQMKAFDRVQNNNMPQKKPIKPKPSDTKKAKAKNTESKGFFATIKGFFK